MTPGGLPLDSGSQQDEDRNEETEDYADAYAEAQQLTADGDLTKASAVMGKATIEWLRYQAKHDPEVRSQMQSWEQSEAGADGGTSAPGGSR